MARKVVLVSIDGWGVAPAGPGNAIHAAKTPNMDKLAKDVRVNWHFTSSSSLAFG